MPTPEIRVAAVTLTAVRFQNEQSKHPIPWEGPLLDLVGRRHLPRVEKKGSPAFSPVDYEPGAQRGKRGILRATAIALDFDHLTTATAEDVARRLARGAWAHVAYSSWSHQADGADDCCFRVVMPVSRPVAPDEYEAVWVAVNAALGRVADANARDLARLWYVACCPPERGDAAWIRTADGRAVDVDGAIAASALKPGATRPKPKARRGQPFAEGGRNAGLTSLGGALRRRGAGEAELAAALNAANDTRCVPPLPAAEVDLIVQSLLRYDPSSPLLTLNLTDAGNAERLKADVGDRFAYVHAWGSWLCFDGVRWSRDGNGEAVRAALATLRRTAAEASRVADEEMRTELVKHALDSESSARISAMVTLGQAFLPVEPDQLDQRPDLLNARNGTVDLSSGALRPHDRADWITRVCTVPFEADAACPLWEAFLLRVMGGRTHLVSFLQRAVGYSLTGHTNEQVLFLLYGTGANGKSTFLETIRTLLADYAAITDFTTFLKREGEGARNDLARLVGTRFVSAVEAEAGKPLAEALVKQLTGGDTITARFLFREFFDFKPEFKIWLGANHKPHISGSDHGIWRRLRLIPFTVTIPEAERDPRLVQKLQGELSGILAWAVRGAIAWRHDGLGVPDEVRSATDAYRDEMDVYGGFLDEHCIGQSGAQVPARELYEAYTSWCEANGEKPRTQKALANGLRERGLEAAKGTKGARVWRGLRLRRESDPVGGGWRIDGASPGYSDHVATSRTQIGAPPVQASAVKEAKYNENAPQSAIRHPGTEVPSFDRGDL